MRRIGRRRRLSRVCTLHCGRSRCRSKNRVVNLATHRARLGRRWNGLFHHSLLIQRKCFGKSQRNGSLPAAWSWPNVIFGPERMVELIWVGWSISWLAASLWSDRAQKRLASLDTWTYRAALIAGAILLAPPTAWLLSEQPLWRLGYRGMSALPASMFIGLSITWWARIYLGRFWSGL